MPVSSSLGLHFPDNECFYTQMPLGYFYSALLSLFPWGCLLSCGRVLLLLLLLFVIDISLMLDHSHFHDVQVISAQNLCV